MSDMTPEQIMSLFMEAAVRVSNPELQKWKAEGKKVVGHVCSHVPEEIVTAAGLLPYRLRGIEITSTAIGDTYFGPFICSCPKAILQNAGDGRLNFLDGAVMVQACDSMRRLDECWRKAAKEKSAHMPGFFHYFGVPHKVTDYSIQWFAEEIETFAKAVESHFGVAITKDALKKAIAVHNETRSLLLRLEELRFRDDPPLTGSQAMAMVLASTAMPKEIYNGLLKSLLDHLEAQPGIDLSGKLRILLAGSVVDDLALIEAIEHEGAYVSADTVCFGARANQGSVDESESVWLTLARHYLNEQFCPRMFGYTKDRFDLILKKYEDSKADGIIFQNIRFCDLHGSENGLFEKRLEKGGIPAIRIEREYGSLADEGRVRMRVGAFLETIAKGAGKQGGRRHA